MLSKMKLKSKTGFAIIVMLVASILLDIVFIETLGYIPAWLAFVKLALLAGAIVLCLLVKDLKPFLNFIMILFAFIAVHIVMVFILRSDIWQSLFDANTFVTVFGSSILLKVIGTIPIIAFLLLILKSRETAYLCKGDLSVKAEPIRWLGIHKDWISWRKLSIISAFLISFGTLLLTLITVTGFSIPSGLDIWVKMLPIILLFALVNSFCEGVMFRSTILGTLRHVLPKNEVIMIAAIFFGIAHYYGAPSGVIGVVMSGLLGWYMCRSMYETRGFASSWVIHFMQDVVIFSSILLLGGFIR